MLPGIPGEQPMFQLTTLLEHLEEAVVPLGTAEAVAHENRLVQVRLGVASSLLTALRWKHAATAAHSVRVALGCSSWALAMELGDQERDNIEIAALLHDIGKIGVPDSILLKPGKLSGDEMALMERHRLIALDVLRSCCSSESVLDIVQNSAAWYDGSRMRVNAIGDDLPLGARMVSIVDAFDSMTSDHVYRSAMSRERAIGELYNCAGTQFDPNLVKLYGQLYQGDQQKLHKRVARRWLQALDPESSNTQWQLNTTAPTPGALVPETLFQQKLLDNMHDAVIFINRNLQVALWNRAAERLTGIAASSVHQRLFLPGLIEMRDEKGLPVSDADCPVAYALHSGVQSLRRLIIAGRNGNDVAVDIHTVPVVSSDGITYGATLVLHDASSETSLEERCQSLHEKAIKDPLTQLANRAEFDRVHELFVAEHLQRGLPCSLIICDIDRFKLVNDTYGHPAGDEVIKSFAQQLKSRCRPGDLVARYGGEEFVMLCADCNNAAAAQRAEQIREGFFRQPQPAIGGKCVSASFGVTEIQAGDSAETMLRRADRALLAAKEMGRNTVVQLGSGINEDFRLHRRSWWSWKTSAPDLLLERRLVTAVPLNVTIEKLRGFVADHHAEITLLEGDRMHLRIHGEPASLLRRTADRAVPFLVELVFTEHRSKLAAGQSASPATSTKIHVTVRPKKDRDRRRNDALERARHLVASLKSYLIASDEEQSDDSMLRRASSIIAPWLSKKEQTNE